MEAVVKVRRGSLVQSYKAKYFVVEKRNGFYSLDIYTSYENAKDDTKFPTISGVRILEVVPCVAKSWYKTYPFGFKLITNSEDKYYYCIASSKAELDAWLSLLDSTFENVRGHDAQEMDHEEMPAAETTIEEDVEKNSVEKYDDIAEQDGENSVSTSSAKGDQLFQANTDNWDIYDQEQGAIRVSGEVGELLLEDSLVVPNRVEEKESNATYSIEDDVFGFTHPVSMSQVTMTLPEQDLSQDVEEMKIDSKMEEDVPEKHNSENYASLAAARMAEMRKDVGKHVVRKPVAEKGVPSPERRSIAIEKWKAQQRILNATTDEEDAFLEDSIQRYQSHLTDDKSSIAEDSTSISESMHHSETTSNDTRSERRRHRKSSGNRVSKSQRRQIEVQDRLSEKHSTKRESSSHRRSSKKESSHKHEKRSEQPSSHRTSSRKSSSKEKRSSKSSKPPLPTNTDAKPTRKYVSPPGLYPPSMESKESTYGPKSDKIKKETSYGPTPPSNDLAAILPDIPDF